MRLALCVCALLLCAGCATSRPDNFWYADTLPQGAVLTTSNGYTCVTPCRLEIPRGGPSVRSFSYVIEKAGYETVTGEARIQTNDTLGAGILLSAAFLAAGAPLIPGPLDNNGYREIEPNPLRVELVRAATVEPAPVATGEVEAGEVERAPETPAAAPIQAPAQ